MRLESFDRARPGATLRGAGTWPKGKSPTPPRATLRGAGTWPSGKSPTPPQATLRGAGTLSKETRTRM
jgi:hypothetical protein